MLAETGRPVSNLRIRRGRARSVPALERRRRTRACPVSDTRRAVAAPPRSPDSKPPTPHSEGIMAGNANPAADEGHRFACPGDPLALQEHRATHRTTRHSQGRTGNALACRVPKRPGLGERRARASHSHTRGPTRLEPRMHILLPHPVTAIAMCSGAPAATFAPGPPSIEAQPGVNGQFRHTRE